MTATVQAPNGRPYEHHTAGQIPVFVAEQPGMGSACGTPHTGHALLIARLTPLREGDLPLAMVRLACGRTFPVRADAIAEATGLATRRILPKRRPA